MKKELTQYKKQLEKMCNEIEEMTQARQKTYEGRSEHWQESTNGVQYWTQNLHLQQLALQASDAIDTIEDILEN